MLINKFLFKFIFLSNSNIIMFIHKILFELKFFFLIQMLLYDFKYYYAPW